MPQGTPTLPDENIDDELLKDVEDSFAEYLKAHPNAEGQLMSNGRGDVSGLPASPSSPRQPTAHRTERTPTTNDSNQGGQSQGSQSSQAEREAIMRNDPNRKAPSGPFTGRNSGGNGNSTAGRVANAAETTEKTARAAEGDLTAIASLAKDHWRGIMVAVFVIAIPFVILGFIIFYAFANPTDFMYHIAQTIGYKESALMVGKGVFDWVTKGNVTGMLPGEVEYHGPNTALADPNTPAPAAGSFADKLSKIDWSKAQYQTKRVICPYSVHTKEVVNSSGETRSVIDYIAGPDGKPATGADPNAVSSCISQRYPILNTLLRQPETRIINYQVGIHLNYATPSDQLPQGDSAKQDEFFRDKTLTRVQDQENKTTSDNQQVTDAIQKAGDLLKQGKSPDQITFNDIGYQLPPDSDPNKQKALALCDFGNVLLTPKNIGESIWSRANGDRRAAYKIATLSSTGKYQLVSSDENNATINALANWDSSYAAQNETNGNSTSGQNIDPEATHNRAIGADQADQDIQNILNLQKGCKDLKDNANFSWGNAFANLAEKLHLPWGSTQAERDAGAIAEINKFYDTLAQQISANSNGVLPTPATVTVEEVILRMVRIGSNVTVSGVEGGPQNFNRQAMGYRQNAFDNMLSMGGRFLTDQEAATSSVVAEAAQRQLDKEKGIAWRLFDTNNTRSVASSFMAMLANPPKVAMVKSLKFSLGLINPINLLKTVNDSTSYVAFGDTNRAMAATDSVDQYFKLNAAGFTDAELGAYNPIDLAKEIENIKQNGTDDQKAALAQYDKCFQTEVTNQLFLYGNNLSKTNTKDKFQPNFAYAPDEIKSQLYTGDLYDDPTKTDPNDPEQYGNMKDPQKPNCAELYSPEPASQGGNRQELIKKYRIYRYNLQAVNALDYLSSPDVEDPALNANQGAGLGLSNNGQHAAGFIWPVPKSAPITQCYGHNGHPGLDIGAPSNTDVAAVQDGTVVRAEGGDATGGYGNLVVIEHKDKGLWTYYAHNQKLNVSVGQAVKQGDIIAQSDSTGNSTGPHVHFEVRTGGANGQTHNPLDYLPNDGRNLAGCTGAFGQ